MTKKRMYVPLIAAMTESRDAMRAEAQRNWEAARDYAAPVLQERRDAFLRSFRTFAASRTARANHSRSARNP